MRFGEGLNFGEDEMNRSLNVEVASAECVHVEDDTNGGNAEVRDAVGFDPTFPLQSTIVGAG